MAKPILKSSPVSNISRALIEVEIFDGATSMGRTNVDDNGQWQLLISGLSVGSHTLTAKSLAASNPVSTPWYIAVKSPIPDFVLDKSPANLTGRVYILPDYPELDPVSWPAGSTHTRVPTSGVAPYTYGSSNVSVAKVDSNGTVYSRKNGSATVTVTDKQGRSGSYSVNVSNVIEVIGLGSTSYQIANNNAAARGKRIPSHDELIEIAVAYLNRWPMGNYQYWSSTPGAQPNTIRCKNLVTGAWADIRTYGVIGGPPAAFVVAI